MRGSPQLNIEILIAPTHRAVFGLVWSQQVDVRGECDFLKAFPGYRKNKRYCANLFHSCLTHRVRLEKPILIKAHNWISNFGWVLSRWGFSFVLTMRDLDWFSSKAPSLYKSGLPKGMILVTVCYPTLNTLLIKSKPNIPTKSQPSLTLMATDYRRQFYHLR